MLIARCATTGEPFYALVEGSVVRRLSGPPYAGLAATGEEHPLEGVRLLAPCQPGKVLAMALNYRTHLGQRAAPTRPEPFLKATSCIVGPGDPVVLPTDAGRVDEEGELVVVMGRRCKGVPAGQALDYVFGYTCGLDVSAREWQGGEDRDIQWWRAKSADTFGPVGPVIATDLDPFAFHLLARVNGREVQRGHASELLFDIPTVIACISRYVTLDPGDLVFTGTPGATTQLHDGDTVEVEVPGVGVLRNPVRSA